MNHGHSWDVVHRYPLTTLLFIISDLAERNNPNPRPESKAVARSDEDVEEVMKGLFL